MQVRALTEIHQEGDGRQSSPFTGNAPHGRLVSRVFSRQRELATILSPPLASRSCKNTQAPQHAFLRHGGIYLVRWGFKVKTKPRCGTEPPPVGRPRTQLKQRLWTTALLLIVPSLVPASYCAIGLLVTITRRR